MIWGTKMKKKRINNRLRLLCLMLCILLIVNSLVATSQNDIHIKNSIEKHILLKKDQNFVPLKVDTHILYVGGSGPNNFTRIQDAIDNASDGDTIFVFDESSPYHENIIINKTISLIGEDCETTLINGNGDKNVIYISSERVNISGFSIQTIGLGPGYSGINIYANLTTISENTLLNNNFGIYIRDSSNNKIIENKFINNECGLTICSANNIIRDNSFFNDGISVGSYNNIIENNTVNFKPIIYLRDQENKTIDYDAGQIILVNCNFTTVKNQNITKTATGISLYNCNNCIVENNNVLDSKSGIIISDSNNNNISFNDLYRNKNFGIGVYSSDYNIFYCNQCSEHKMGKYVRHGMHMSGGDNNTILRNVFKSNGVGLGLSYSFGNFISLNYIHFNFYIGIKLDYNSENNSICKNRIYCNDRGIILDEVSFNSITENNFIENDKNLDLDIIQFYKLRLGRFPKINKNYWGRERILPKFIPGEFTFVYMDVPWGGYMTINWIFIDWHPAKRQYSLW